MESLLSLVILSILVESSVEVLKTLYQGGKLKTDSMTAMAVGMIISFTTDMNILTLLNMENNHVIGIVITGILISRGSNYLHDLINKINGYQPNSNMKEDDDYGKGSNK